MGSLSRAPYAHAACLDWCSCMRINKLAKWFGRFSNRRGWEEQTKMNGAKKIASFVLNNERATAASTFWRQNLNRPGAYIDSNGGADWESVSPHQIPHFVNLLIFHSFRRN